MYEVSSLSETMSSPWETVSLLWKTVSSTGVALWTHYNVAL
jgi:hypothetical protein